MIILSNNLWNNDNNLPAWIAKGEDCSADARVHGLADTYLSVSPDIIGFQEMSRHMEAILFKALEEKGSPYTIISGGYTPIFYRADRVDLLESGYFCYPEEIAEMEGSFNDARSKGYSFGVFAEKATKKKVVVFSTHLWWKSDCPESRSYQKDSGKARAYQIAVAAERCKQLSEGYRCPVILMGDFNDKYYTPTVQSLLKNGWRHAHDICTGETCQTAGYHYCFGDGWRHDPPGEFPDAIDHILVHNIGNAEISSFLRMEAPSFEPLSDHFPVYINIEL